jgi:CheY-like chemotaxis protein
VDITRGLGTFSRVDSSNAARTDVKVALDAALNMTANEIAHRARLVKDIGHLPAVWAADGKLSQVFLNLLINACHAIDEGDVRNNQILIRTWSDKDEVCVEIADTGKGIAPEMLERIFEPFFTTKAIGVGSGLGLSISKNILAEFKGSLSVTSEVGKGSLFTVRLPVMSETQRESTELNVVDVPTDPIVHGRILIVDDEESIRRSLVRLLGLDHEVIADASGKEAQERILSDSTFDLVLCDLMMAHMSGIEFHAWLSAHYPILGNRLVFFTGGAFTPKVSEYLASVGNLTIQKPFDSKSLPMRVAGLIRLAKNSG